MFPFVAFGPLVSVAIDVYLSGKVSMANFNSALTLGFLSAKHIATKTVNPLHHSRDKRRSIWEHFCKVFDGV